MYSDMKMESRLAHAVLRQYVLRQVNSMNSSIEWKYRITISSTHSRLNNCWSAMNLVSAYSSSDQIAKSPPVAFAMNLLNAISSFGLVRVKRTGLPFCSRRNSLVGIMSASIT